MRNSHCDHSTRANPVCQLRLGFLSTILLALASASPAQTLTTLYTFTGGADGAAPKGTLVQGKDGNFYGTTSGHSTVFKITPDGTLTTLHTFDGADGVGSFGTLALGPDGNFYGTTTLSSPGAGTIFKITSAGIFTTLHTFNVLDGNGPWGGLVLGGDGNFYGTTTSGGEYVVGTATGIGAGTVFKIAPDGTFTNLYVFNSSQYVANGGAGADPIGTLAVGTDGNFYGTTAIGGASFAGTVFKITPGGTLTTLHSFNGKDGADPWGTLVLGDDGNFYGTTTAGGAFGQGTIFQITPTGTLTTLHSFNGADGQGPIAGLVKGNAGNFYGAAQTGGASTLFGTLFEVTPGGTFTLLYSFSGTDGSFPYSGLTLGGDGNFYGTTDGGGKNAVGTIFRLSLADASGAPSVNANGVVNAATNKAPVAAGSIAAVFGTFPISEAVSSTSFPIPTDFSGLSLEFGSAPPAPLFFGSSLQINAQIPWELAGEQQTTVSALLNGEGGAPQTITLAPYAPGIFVVNSQTNQGAILDAKYQLITPANPAAAGSSVLIFCIGLGPVTNQPATGAPALSKPLSETTAAPTVNIGGAAATVLFSGLSPGDVGLYQINVQVPAGATSGAAVPVNVSIGGANSNTVSTSIR